MYPYMNMIQQSTPISTPIKSRYSNYYYFFIWKAKLRPKYGRFCISKKQVYYSVLLLEMWKVSKNAQVVTTTINKTKTNRKKVRKMKCRGKSVPHEKYISTTQQQVNYVPNLTLYQLIILLHLQSFTVITFRPIVSVNISYRGGLIKEASQADHSLISNGIRL